MAKTVRDSGGKYSSIGEREHVPWETVAGNLSPSE